jgi:hypothetical protein
MVVALAVLALGLSVGVAAELKSGPQVGDRLPGAFHPLNVCNVDLPDNNGKKACFVCQYGLSPVALVFTRELNEPLAALCKQLDASVAKNKETKACVLLLTDSEGAEGKLKEWATKHGFKNVSFGVDNPAGPTAYKVAKEADVTVILYKQQKIAANHAFKKGEFTEKAVAKIVEDMPKIVASK